MQLPFVLQSASNEGGGQVLEPFMDRVEGTTRHDGHRYVRATFTTSEEFGRYSFSQQRL